MRAAIEAAARADVKVIADDYIQSRQRVQRIGLEHKPLMINLRALAFRLSSPIMARRTP